MATIMMKKAKGQFRVAGINEGKCTLDSYNRRDFYKISLVTEGSPCSLRYGSLPDIYVDKPALMLVNPIVPYNWTVPERLIPADGYFCVFNDEFIRASAQLSGLMDRLFTTQESPVYFPDAVTQQFLTGLFIRMRSDADMDYTDKDELYRSHLSLIFHEAIKMRRTTDTAENGIPRVAAEFIRLLNHQFPIDMPLQPISLKKASDYADRIAVHVNHLNMAVQKATGKSTTMHISERLFAEAKSLLSYTEYTLADIAAGLGFEYQSYFNRFFKKYAGVTPSDYRKNFEKYK
ncbi:helix-turn-helix domain-containing protein [Chitinophaga pinensis]|uniref:Transcriptional regulator, AraC family n=1 Tax=Chitinophaga pinensis (strain ATCC 43595 / DSM 2588 / LMG 13176 / NBRC 15968 / NCIMB 11800 / UQM 2034) TaxID=485918 RepID=A0A979G1B2_CHIPD|nr:helix-turn-helix domain-containing protein [Chitinophaga pinensis]ACU58886.1 transcriptional regulator, AraC family [Chitinophaga pinensis DSM 2588]